MKPNVLVIFLDQLRAFEVGCYGHGVVETPNMDRLARRGVRFENAFSNNPVCTPARSILVSGQYSRTACGMMGNWGAPETVRSRLVQPTLPEELKAEGYYAAHLGKWHIAIHPFLAGFDNYESEHQRWSGPPPFFPFKKDWHNELAGMEGKGRGPEWENRLLRDFFDTKPQDRAWFCYHNIHLPHAPWNLAPAQAMERYSRDQVALRPNVYDRDGRVVEDRQWFLKHWHEGKFGTVDNELLAGEYDLIDYCRHYYAAVTVADEQVGYALDRLEASGEADNTIVILTADHGDNLGSHGLYNKETMNEESIRIPMIMAGPGIPAGEVRASLASLVDIPATILSLVGASAPEHFQGKDLAPVMQDASESGGQDAVFIEGMQDDIAIRTATRKVTHKVEGGWNNAPKRTVVTPPSGVYDLEADPYEQNNLAATPPAWAEELSRRLLAWDASTPWQNEIPE